MFVACQAALGWVYFSLSPRGWTRRRSFMSTIGHGLLEPAWPSPVSLRKFSSFATPWLCQVLLLGYQSYYQCWPASLVGCRGPRLIPSAIRGQLCQGLGGLLSLPCGSWEGPHVSVSVRDSNASAGLRAWLAQSLTSFGCWLPAFYGMESQAISVSEVSTLRSKASILGHSSCASPFLLLSLLSREACDAEVYLLAQAMRAVGQLARAFPVMAADWIRDASAYEPRSARPRC